MKKTDINLEIGEKVYITPKLPEVNNIRFFSMLKGQESLEEIVNTFGFAQINEENRKKIGPIIGSIMDKQKCLYVAIPSMESTKEVFVNWKKRSIHGTMGEADFRCTMPTTCGNFEVTILNDTRAFLERIK